MAGLYRKLFLQPLPREIAGGAVPNIIKELMADSAYIWCPTCRGNGNPRVMLKRRNHLLVCTFGHQFDSTHQLGSKDPMDGFYDKPDMTPMSELLTEQPSANAEKWSIWVHPRTKQRLIDKFPQNLWVTLGVLLDSLCDGSLILISGEDAKKLRASGVTNGATAVAMTESSKQLEKDRDQAVQKLDELQQILKAAGVA
jgi:hypothetical protein